MRIAGLSPSERQTAREEGMREFLMTIMSRRLGEVPGCIVRRLDKFVEKDLKDFALALYDLDSYAGLEQWLVNH
jgi:hypothetical protein